VLDLVAKADRRLIEGFRPGVMERLGPRSGKPATRSIRVWSTRRMTGWGQQGPMAQEAGHDINYLALTGALHCLGEADRPPPPAAQSGRRSRRRSALSGGGPARGGDGSPRIGAGDRPSMSPWIDGRHAF